MLEIAILSLCRLYLCWIVLFEIDHHVLPCLWNRALMAHLAGAVSVATNNRCESCRAGYE